jgi:hypothetical protein
MINLWVGCKDKPLITFVFSSPYAVLEKLDGRYIYLEVLWGGGVNTPWVDQMILSRKPTYNTYMNHDGIIFIHPSNRERYWRDKLMHQAHRHIAPLRTDVVVEVIWGGRCDD